MTFKIRRAEATDVDAIASAHLDSIQSIGPRYYPSDVVQDWCGDVERDRYLVAMAGGEKFFVALGDADDVVGFSSHRVDNGQHGVAVYVCGKSARSGIGSALLRSAEASAVAEGATSLHIDASLAAVEFYAANGFDEVGRGAHRLSSGRSMTCVFMRKALQ